MSFEEIGREAQHEAAPIQGNPDRTDSYSPTNKRPTMRSGREQASLVKQ